MKVILADTHGLILGKAQTSPNLGLLYLASYARQHITNIEFHYIPQKYTENYHYEMVDKHRPEVYALSCTSYGAATAYRLINNLKAKYPKMLIIAGGAHVSAVPKDVLEFCKADIAIIGEGEITFTEILQNLNNLEEVLPKIDGIGYMKDGKYKATNGRNPIDNIDSIPFPARDLAQREDFIGIPLLKNTPSTEVIITRGCPFRCTFCANPVFRYKEGLPLYRRRTPENIAEEVEELYQMGYRELYLHSDELNVSLEWSIDVCKALAALGHTDLYFQCNLRVIPMSEEFAYWLKKANFWLIRFGVESANDRVLTGIKKKMSVERTLNACKVISDQGIKVLGYFMMYQFWRDENGTFQYETTEEVERTIKFAEKIWKNGWLDYIAFIVSTPVQGAEMYDVAIAEKMIDKSYIPGDTWIPSKYIEGISDKDFHRLMRKGRFLQMKMALFSGGVNWKNIDGLLIKIRDLITGRKGLAVD
ncbi:MAG: B12-binding domain-containing radical SAM protein [Sporocytophaga sp.]|uniref:B12-binding domain-containing radical SAM protein n=1 Tax=Sporocytophaga sp. TaxID=2231183 RepID=UPI001B210A71|nr:radical SAM protein [Sporocytophaga sp.]MBO9699301.1 B12-binding domain-containing radical SAM protein [Sporocytophaga sp.]